MFDLCCRMQVPEVDLLLAIIQGVSPILGKGAVAQAVAPNVGPDAGAELGATQDDSMTASPRVLVPPEQSIPEKMLPMTADSSINGRAELSRQWQSKRPRSSNANGDVAMMLCYDRVYHAMQCSIGLHEANHSFGSLGMCDIG